MNRISGAVGILSRLGLYVAMAMTLGVMLLVTADVVLRATMNASIAGTVEIVEFMQGMAVFLGLAYTLRQGGHIAADFLVEYLAPRTRAGIDLFTGAVSLLVFAAMTYALWAIATRPGAASEISDLLGIAVQPFKLVAATGVGLMCLEMVLQIVRTLRSLRGAGGAAS